MMKQEAKGGSFPRSDVTMNFLLLILIIACPFWVLDLACRLLNVTPPVWISDAMAVSLMFAVLGIVITSIAPMKRRQKAAQAGEAAPAPIPESPLPRGLETAGMPAMESLEEALPYLFHEIRNYSSALRGNAVLLKRQLQSETILEPLCRMERTTRKIECLAEELLGTACSKTGCRLESIDIQALVKDCVTDHFPGAKDSIRLIAEGVFPAIQGDRLKLERVFMNLFRNAFEAGARTISVRIMVVPEGLRIVVEDDGHGCADNQVAQLFRPLFTTKKETGGTGLGLYLVKATIEAHGGAIRALSKNQAGMETGMIFRLDLPREKRPKNGLLTSAGIDRLVQASN
jgi:signal transduction histidine kinase